jgi:two-component system nitrate/nitrite response regulator NarL
MTITVFVADDHPVYREALTEHWQRTDALKVVGSAGDGVEALAAIRELMPEVAVVDLKLPGTDGLEIVAELTRTSCPTAVVLLTAYVDSAIVYRALQAGARGYLEKSAALEEITTAVTEVAGGQTAIAPSVSSALAAGIRTSNGAQGQTPLTERETDILRCAADGLSSQQIARDLGISVPTVKTHLAHVYAKLQVPDRASAVAQAFRRGILT